MLLDIAVRSVVFNQASPKGHAPFLPCAGSFRNRQSVTGGEPGVSLRNALRAWIVALAMLIAATAFAAHPLQTEDTGTQGTGNIEIENGLSRTRAGADSSFGYQPQLSVGASPVLDLIAQPSWLYNRVSGDGSTRGIGDTNLDAKWRFFGEAPYSLAVRGGLALPTSQHDLGLPHGKTGAHVLLATTLDATPITIHGNLAFAHSPVAGARADTTHVSAAVMWLLATYKVLEARRWS